jgi:hypothetical protein
MRTLLKVTVDTTAGNKAISEGTLPQVIGSTMEKLKPEAAYFYTVEGCRSCFMVFDMTDPSQIPVIAEPFFNSLNAKVEFCPVMNIEDLQKGLGTLQQNQ